MSKVLIKKNKQAFTLIELLVVIAIIGLLSTIAVASLYNSNAKARDAERVHNLKQVQTALEMYYDKNGDYPRINDFWQHSCSSNWFSVLQPLIDEGFLPALPSDPVNEINGTEYLCYEYLARSDAVQSGWFCDTVRRTDYEYVLIFSTEASTPDLPAVTGGYYDYCLAGPKK